MDYAFAQEQIGLGSLPPTRHDRPSFDLSLLRGPTGVGQEPEGLGQEPEGFGREPTGLGDGISQNLKKIPTCPGGWSEIYPNDVKGLSPFTSTTLPAVLYTLSTQFAAPAKYGVAIQSDGFMYFMFTSNTAGGGFGPATNLMRYNGTRIGICLAQTVPVTPTPTPVTTPVITGPIATPGPVVAPPAASPGPAQITWLANAWVVGGDPSAPPSAVPPGTPLTAGVAGTWVWRPSMNLPGGGVIAVWMWYPPHGILTALGPAGAQVYVVAFPGQVSSSTYVVPTSPPPGMVGQWVQAHNSYFVFVPATGMAPAPTTTAVAAATDYTWLWLLGGVVVIGGVAYLLLD